MRTNVQTDVLSSTIRTRLSVFTIHETKQHSYFNNWGLKKCCYNAKLQGYEAVEFLN